MGKNIIKKIIRFVLVGIFRYPIALAFTLTSPILYFGLWIFKDEENSDFNIYQEVKEFLIFFWRGY